MGSPARIDPNKVKMREQYGGEDQAQEEAYRRESYKLYKENLSEAFDKFDSLNRDGYLNFQEFSNFMNDAAEKSGQ